MPRLAATLIALLCTGSAAQASGGLDCSFSDKTGSFDVQMAVSHGLGSQISSLTGEIELKDKAFPKDVGKITFTTGDLIHRWLANRSANLHFWKEGGDKDGFAEVELVITAREVAGEFYAARGGYELTLRYMKAPGDAEATVLTRKGKIKCGGE